MQFALRLVFFPQPRSIDAGKQRPLLVPLCFPPCSWSLATKVPRRASNAVFAKAIDRTRFDVDQRTPMSEDEAICAQIKPNTVSIRDSVKLLPTRRVDESLGVSLKPCLE